MSVHAVGSCWSTQAEVRFQEQVRTCSSTMGTMDPTQSIRLVQQALLTAEPSCRPYLTDLNINPKKENLPPPPTGHCRNLCKSSPRTTCKVLQQCSRTACSLMLWACAFGVCQSNSSSLAPEGFEHWGLLGGQARSALTIRVPSFFVLRMEESSLGCGFCQCPRVLWEY